MSELRDHNSMRRTYMTNERRTTLIITYLEVKMLNCKTVAFLVSTSTSKLGRE